MIAGHLSILPLTDHVVGYFETIIAYQNSLKRHLGVQYNEHDFLFTNKRGEIIDPRTYCELFYDISRVAGITRPNFHSLRHTFATNCIEEGIAVTNLAKMLGHAQPSTTLNMYGHAMDESLVRIRGQLSQKKNPVIHRKTSSVT